LSSRRRPGQGAVDPEPQRDDGSDEPFMKGV
jgi:hypothetical protein